jgi:hypothetical protein
MMELLSKFAYNFNLRRYIMAGVVGAGAGAVNGVGSALVARLEASDAAGKALQVETS